MKQITVKDEYDNKYSLEYSKSSILQMEKSGFSVDKMSESPVLMITMLYQGAFIKNHRNTKAETMDKIYASLNKKEEFIQKLLEMYNEQSDALVDEGNADWEANF